jgi:hypothetical protein
MFGLVLVYQQTSMAKVTVYLDDDVWSKFRASVFEKHGSLKVLSKQVELSLKQALQEDEVLTYLARLRGKGSPKKHDRPQLKGAPAEVDVREMRRRRFESEARLERFQKNMRGRLKNWKEEDHRADKGPAKQMTKQRHA